MKLRELLQKATPGPWRHRTGGNLSNAIEAFSGETSEYSDGFRVVATYQECEPTGYAKAEKENAEANRDLIIYLRNNAEAIADLIDAAQRMKAASEILGRFQEDDKSVSTDAACKAELSEDEAKEDICAAVAKLSEDA